MFQSVNSRTHGRADRRRLESNPISSPEPKNDADAPISCIENVRLFFKTDKQFCLNEAEQTNTAVHVCVFVPCAIYKPKQTKLWG